MPLHYTLVSTTWYFVGCSVEIDLFLKEVTFLMLFVERNSGGTGY